MSLVADGPLIHVSGRVPEPMSASRRTASGTRPTIWSTRTTTMCRSGTSEIARRPCASPPSSTIVPVSAIATAQPVSTASTESIALGGQRTVVDDDGSPPKPANHAGTSSGTSSRVTPSARPCVDECTVAL